MWLNCLTGLAPGIVSIVVILPITCTFCMSVPLSRVFPHLLCLALGQRQSQMYYSFYRCLVVLSAALEGFLLFVLSGCLLFAYRLLIACLLTAY